MTRKTTKKVLTLSSETLKQLESKETAIGSPGTQDSRPFCCP